MEEEIKKAYMDWSEKGVSYLNCIFVYDIMMDVDEALQTCDTILDEIDLGIDYTSREKDIDRLLEGHGTLHRYIDVLNCYVDDKLDQPLKKDFKKNATETISRIHLEDFEVDNTLGLTENNYITGGMGYAGTMVEQEKAKLTFADFIGTSDGKADGNGFHMAYTNGSVEDFASIFAAQYEAMKASGALGEDNNLTQQEFLEQFYRQGEFTHDSSNPFLNFVSSVLDITIIKPVIESCIGEDLITGEDLTDMERGLKVVFAMVDLVTLGGAIAATKFSEMGLKEGLKAFGKTALIDFAGNTAACGVGALGETFDWPVPITMMLSLAAGITVSISGNKLLFKNADGIEIGSKTLSDDDLKIVEQTIEGENYSNLTEVVSAKEAEVYLHFLESGSTEGMTESELKAVQKIEELIKSNKIDYDGILKIRNETVKSDVEVVRKTTEDSLEDVGRSAAEDAGKVVESGSNTFGNYSTKIDSKVTVVEKQELPSWLIDTYKDGVYRTVVTNEDITVYRSFGYNAEAGGAFATSSPAVNRIQTKVDSAILPEWKNTLRYEAEIVIPKGTTLNIGRVGEQFTMSGTRLAGDADQFLLPQNWDLNWIKSIREVKL